LVNEWIHFFTFLIQSIFVVIEREIFFMIARINTIPSLRYLSKFRTDPIRMMNELQAELGDLVELKVGPKKLLFCFHPDHAEGILKTDASRYQKSRLIFNKIAPLTGPRGLVQLEGTQGREHRQMTGPALAYESMQSVYPLLIQATQEEAARLLKDKEKELDLVQVLTRLVLRNAVILVFGRDLSQDSSELMDSFLEANTLCGEKIRSFISLPYLFPTTQNRKLRKAIQALDRSIYALMEKPTPGKNLLVTLMQKGLDRNQIRDHLVTFLFAGHETTATSLAWTCFLLSRNPSEEQAVREECKQILGSGEPRLDDLRKLRRTLNAYQEALRLFPPAWTLAREAKESTDLNGYRVEKGTTLLLGVGQIQRHPKFWSDPQHFLPDRFQSEARHPYAYIPFGGGSRICIGMRTAMIEAALVISVMLPRMKIQLRPDYRPEVEALITAHPKNPMFARVQEVGEDP